MVDPELCLWCHFHQTPSLTEEKPFAQTCHSNAGRPLQNWAWRSCCVTGVCLFSAHTQMMSNVCSGMSDVKPHTMFCKQIVKIRLLMCFSWICLSNRDNPPRGRTTKSKRPPPAARGTDAPANTIPAYSASDGHWATGAGWKSKFVAIWSRKSAVKTAFSALPEHWVFLDPWWRAGQSSFSVKSWRGWKSWSPCISNCVVCFETRFNGPPQTVEVMKN